MHGGVLYKSRYGSTKQYAQWVSHDLHLPILDIDEVAEEAIVNHDFFVIGSPIYIGKILIGKWLRRHQQMLRRKKIFLFLVCGSSLKSDAEISKILAENIPGELEPSCVVFFLPGKIIRRKLSLLDRILLIVGAAIEKDLAAKKQMKKDFDTVDKIHLHELEAVVRSYNTDPVSYPALTSLTNGNNSI